VGTLAIRMNVERQFAALIGEIERQNGVPR
jgi:hypothetical protein